MILVGRGGAGGKVQYWISYQEVPVVLMGQ